MANTCKLVATLLLVLATMVPTVAHACERNFCFNDGGSNGAWVTCCQLLPDSRSGCYYSCVTFYCPAPPAGGVVGCLDHQIPPFD